jgi:hypothetical protein|tara:strand:- start:46 stop:339 length:294 start_codon:yes stop_codon:yes gene_type:complete
MAEDRDDFIIRSIREDREIREALTKEGPLKKQIGGDHYRNCKIQPVEYICANNLDFLEGNIVKYITRHRTKSEGVKDIKKVIHYAELILQLVYNESK